jgi:LPS-assembly protein
VIRRVVFRLGVMLAALLALSAAARAQDGDLPLALFADSVRYETTGQVLTAEGNVEVYYQGSRLTARAIRYDAVAGRITADGPLRIATPDGAILTATMAELSPDLRDGLIRGARLLLAERFQVASVEARRSEGRFTTLDRAIGSSCQVCIDDPVPVWRIRARRVTHDSETRRILFQDATFDLFGLPVGYLPRLQIPDPTVERASGFLAPDFSQSDIYGAGLKLPYYLVLGDHADATLTPFATTGGSQILELEYRRRFRRGTLTIDGALALTDGLGERSGRGFVLATATRALARGFTGDFQLNIASDDSFLRQYGFSDDDRLTSFAVLSRFRDKDRAEFRIQGFQSLRDDEDNAENPLILPEFTYRRRLGAEPFGGRLSLDASLLGLVREDGQDVLRLGAGIDWQATATLPSGLQVAGIARLSGEYYTYDQRDTAPSADQFRLTPTAGVELRFPLVRHDTGATHVIEPVAQLLYTSRRNDDGIVNEDSLLPELDETNLFALNRFPGIDRYESGLRANLGVTYRRLDPTGWNLGVTIGQVIRRQPDPEFAPGTGLSGTRSDFVAAVSYELPPNLSVLSRVQFDDRLDFKRSEVEVAMDYDRFDLTGGILFLAADDSNPALGTIERRNELTLDARYRFADNWELAGAWDYDLAAGRNIRAGGGLTYGNECIELDLSLSRRFTTSNNVPPSTDIGLTVRLAGFGGNAADRWPARQCRGLGL